MAEATKGDRRRIAREADDHTRGAQRASTGSRLRTQQAQRQFRQGTPAFDIDAVSHLGRLAPVHHDGLFDRQARRATGGQCQVAAQVVHPITGDGLAGLEFHRHQPGAAVEQQVDFHAEFVAPVVHGGCQAVVAARLEHFADGPGFEQGLTQ